MKKILFVIPHLSTGGLPQVVVNKVELLKSDFQVKCIEYDFLGDAYVVQKNRLIDLVGKDNLITFGEDKKKLLEIINDYDPDVISFEEFPEYFVSDEISAQIYKEDRKYTILETTHDSSFPVTNKRWFPDKFIFVSAFNAFRYSMFDIPYDIIEYPIDKKVPNKKWAQTELGLDPAYKHVVCVGLFTQRKNQGYLFEIAKDLEDRKILFHFIGNQADNFQDYWKPLMSNKPKNCIVWGERKDVDTFLQACDLFFFPSKGDRNNKELNPIAIKEAIVYDLPMMMFDLDVYCGKYSDNKNITFLTGDMQKDRNSLLSIFGEANILDLDLKNLFTLSYENDENKINIYYSGNENRKFKLSVRDMTSTAPIYWLNIEVGSGSVYFIIPIPTHIMKFHRDPYFRGFTLEFYDDDKFLFSKEIVVNDILPRIKKINFLPFDCNYVNYYEFFAEKSFDKDCLNDMDLVIDIGANVGLFSKYMKERGAKNIIMVEGNPLLGDSIKTVMGNDMSDCTLYLNPIFSEKKTMEFNYPSDNSTIGELVFDDHYPYNTTIDVETVTLDEIYESIGDKRISLFKCDIEGGEYPLFESMTNEQIKRVDKFMVEFHKNNNGEIDIILNRLTENGFEFDITNTHMGIRYNVDSDNEHGFIITR